MKPQRTLSRRDFLKLSTLGVGAAILHPLRPLTRPEDFPQSERLGRAIPGKVELKSRPDASSPTNGVLYQDAVFPWLRETVGSRPFRTNQRWIETPEGYLWSPEVQPVENQPNAPIERLPHTSLGRAMWAEVSVPYINLSLANPPARAPWLKNRLETGLTPRFYYSQIAWVDQIRADDNGQVWYRINERFGHGDIFWAAAEAFRPLTKEESSPLSPDVPDKRIVVDISTQTMSCFEGDTEVHFARVSTGAMVNSEGKRVEDWGTPLGTHRIWRKAISLPLSGGSSAVGWDLPAVGWVSLFEGTGVAFHSTYWHNNYGVPTSRGCVNCRPEDAKWVFRWTLPEVSYDPGDVTVSIPGGTVIEVIDI